MLEGSLVILGNEAQVAPIFLSRFEVEIPLVQSEEHSCGADWSGNLEAGFCRINRDRFTGRPSCIPPSLGNGLRGE